MSTQEIQSSSLEAKKPLRRTQEFLRELKVTITLLRDLLAEVKWEKLELNFYRMIIITVTVIHLIEFMWYSLWH
jgi:hypothetical protein